MLPLSLTIQILPRYRHANLVIDIVIRRTNTVFADMDCQRFFTLAKEIYAKIVVYRIKQHQVLWVRPEPSEVARRERPSRLRASLPHS